MTTSKYFILIRQYEEVAHDFLLVYTEVSLRAAGKGNGFQRSLKVTDDDSLTDTIGL